MKHVRFLGLTLLLFAATSCVPVVRDTRPKVAFLNAPTEDRVLGLAEELESLIREEPTTFGFTRSSPLRYQESHRDMYGSRAALQAAFAARSQGSAYAVMVGFENEGDAVRTSLNGTKLELTLNLKGRAVASIVDPTTAEVLGTFESSEVTAKVYETVTLDLPEGLSPLDPRAQAILEQQAEDAKERALKRFLDDYAKEPLSELVDPLTSELSRLIPTVAAL
jgi:hypothetical protein